GLCRRSYCPPHCVHNGHIFYLLAPSAETQGRWLAALKTAGVNALFHYVPLHSAPAGLRFGRTAGSMAVTDRIASRLIRLPLHLQLSESQQDRIIEKTLAVVGR